MKMFSRLLEDSAFAFRGIPYAVPPVGSLRWTPASPMNSLSKCWNGTFEAHNATRPCWQSYTNGTIDGDEDCLTLDVVTPHVRYDNPLPVVVLIGKFCIKYSKLVCSNYKYLQVPNQ